MVHKIKIKIGDAEFEAEGAPEDVQSQYDRFLTTLERVAQKPANTTAPSPSNNKHPVEERSPVSLDDPQWARIFEQRHDGLMTLKALPKGENREADAYLLLLYGFRQFKKIDRVLATNLLRSAQYSGFSNSRPADALASQDRYIIRGGLKKGTTYTLNNQGVGRAEEIAAKIFE